MQISPKRNGTRRDLWERRSCSRLVPEHVAPTRRHPNPGWILVFPLITTHLLPLLLLDRNDNITTCVKFIHWQRDFEHFLLLLKIARPLIITPQTPLKNWKSRCLDDDGLIYAPPGLSTVNLLSPTPSKWSLHWQSNPIIAKVTFNTWAPRPPLSSNQWLFFFTIMIEHSPLLVCFVPTLMCLTISSLV